MPTLEERFWIRVQKCRHGQTCSRCCWEWQGPRNHAGYGTYYVRGDGNIPAHRYALELTCGAMILGEFWSYSHKGIPRHWVVRHGPAGLCVMHHCDNPPCCNPRHLRIATYGDNIRDASQKGRLRHQRMRQEASHDA